MDKEKVFIMSDEVLNAINKVYDSVLLIFPKSPIIIIFGFLAAEQGYLSSHIKSVVLLTRM